MAAGIPASPSEVPSELTLRVGERKIILLTSAGSVGYVWQLRVTGDTQTIEASTGPEHARRPDAPPGGSLQQALFVTAVAPGKSAIHLDLLRFGHAPPRESHQITVTVIP
ncbi:protease inhibitor I42 family protein [Paraburkholderia sp. BR10937]|uniref:protease inhibitor I42 family protein n=1 Tax=Paraburkholderia sp. BR10937 TaxID=3236994 RepID=UPI0034D28470